VKAPIVISRVEPIYTDEARANRISGIVIVEAVIGRDGLVKNVQVLKPLPFGLDQAAADAVRQWVFRPGTLNGEPVDVIFNLTVNFRLDTPAPPQP
jgi:protein TonB